MQRFYRDTIGSHPDGIARALGFAGASAVVPLDDAVAAMRALLGRPPVSKGRTILLTGLPFSGRRMAAASLAFDWLDTNANADGLACVDVVEAHEIDEKLATPPNALQIVGDVTRAKLLDLDRIKRIVEPADAHHKIVITTTGLLGPATRDLRATIDQIEKASPGRVFGVRTTGAAPRLLGESHDAEIAELVAQELLAADTTGLAKLLDVFAFLGKDAVSFPKTVVATLLWHVFEHDLDAIAAAYPELLWSDDRPRSSGADGRGRPSLHSELLRACWSRRDPDENEILGAIRQSPQTLARALHSGAQTVIDLWLRAGVPLDAILPLLESVPPDDARAVIQSLASLVDESTAFDAAPDSLASRVLAAAAATKALAESDVAAALASPWSLAAICESVELKNAAALVEQIGRAADEKEILDAGADALLAVLRDPWQTYDVPSVCGGVLFLWSQHSAIAQGISGLALSVSNDERGPFVTTLANAAASGALELSLLTAAASAVLVADPERGISFASAVLSELASEPRFAFALPVLVRARETHAAPRLCDALLRSYLRHPEPVAVWIAARMLRRLAAHELLPPVDDLMGAIEDEIAQSDPSRMTLATKLGMRNLSTAPLDPQLVELAQEPDLVAQWAAQLWDDASEESSKVPAPAFDEGWMGRRVVPASWLQRGAHRLRSDHAAELLEARRLREAAIELRERVVADPKDADAHRMLASIFHLVGNMSGERKHLSAVLALDPTDTAAANGLADIHLAAEEWEHAERMLMIVVEHARSEREHARALERLITIGEHLPTFDSTVARGWDSLARHGYDVDVIVHLLRAIARGSGATASQIARVLLRHYDVSASGAAVILSRAGLVDDAIRHASNAIASDGSALGEVLVGEGAFGDAKLWQARRSIREGVFEAAEAIADRLHDDLNIPDRMLLRGALHCARGRRLFDAQMPHAAAVEFQRGLRAAEEMLWTGYCGTQLDLLIAECCAHLHLTGSTEPNIRDRALRHYRAAALPGELAKVVDERMFVFECRSILDALDGSLRAGATKEAAAAVDDLLARRPAANTHEPRTSDILTSAATRVAEVLTDELRVGADGASALHELLDTLLTRGFNSLHSATDAHEQARLGDLHWLHARLVEEPERVVEHTSAAIDAWSDAQRNVRSMYWGQTRGLAEELEVKLAQAKRRLKALTR